MWVELPLPARNSFLIYKQHIEEERKLFGHSLKYAFLHRALLIGKSIVVSFFHIVINLVTWTVIASVAFFLKFFEPQYSFLVWLSAVFLIYRGLLVVFRLNEYFGDPLSRRIYLLSTNKLTVKILGSKKGSLGRVKEKILTIAASKGHPINSWEKLERIFSGIVTFLLCSLFVAEWIPVESVIILVKVLAIVFYMSFDLLFLGLPTAVFENPVDVAQFGDRVRISLELVKIGMSLGIIATTVKIFKVGCASREPYQGSVSNLSKYLDKYEATKEGIVIYDCGIVPEEAPEYSQNIPKTPGEIRECANRELKELSDAIDQQISIALGN
ncbi:hypothetical protein [Halomonas daqiaonensis]|uniref:Uncharacterized protein n=1 Tax=Halomonas daqiaonensis TaxID=650850 RepID=A0A1H7WQF4_9GAMM|nr:hypothetical protein [Halomonas daqiaonensis]SEM23238.1 hypothetical protein SAMN04488129_1383 [Halomonas daqiaonensis]